MSTYNSVTIVGRIGNIDVKGSTLSLSVATNNSYKDKDTGKYEKETLWHRIVLFSDNAKRAEQFLEKGNLCLFEGALSYYKTEKDGVKLTYTSIKAYKFIKLSPKNTDAAPQNNWCENNLKTDSTSQEKFDDEIPF